MPEEQVTALPPEVRQMVMTGTNAMLNNNGPNPAMMGMMDMGMMHPMAMEMGMMSSGMMPDGSSGPGANGTPEPIMQEGYPSGGGQGMMNQMGEYGMQVGSDAEITGMVILIYIAGSDVPGDGTTSPGSWTQWARCSSRFPWTRRTGSCSSWIRTGTWRAHELWSRRSVLFLRCLIKADSLISRRNTSTCFAVTSQCANWASEPEQVQGSGWECACCRWTGLWCWWSHRKWGAGGKGKVFHLISLLFTLLKSH